MSEKEKVWSTTSTPNLALHIPSGIYYLRARFGSHPVKESMRTRNYAVAKIKFHDRMTELRANNPRHRGEVTTLAEALAIVRVQIGNDPTLKASSKRTYCDWLDDLAPGAPAAVPLTKLSRLASAELEAWWGNAAAKYAPSRANALFMLVKRALRVARKAGALSRDLMEDMRRVDVPESELALITLDQLRLLLAAVRARSSEAADWVEFMTYCGLRPGEVEALLWEHVGQTSIAVHGGKEGPKNRKVRHVPMVPDMVLLIERMRGPFPRAGRLFSINRPKAVFKRACKDLGHPALRIYDLRHMFATICMQSGVAAPVFAKWLGHQDKGALAMRRYVHPLEQHEIDAAASVKF